MRKIVSLAVLTTLVAACTQPNSGTSVSDYGTDGFGEEVLITDDSQVLNNTYLMAPAPKYYIGNAYKVEDIQYIPVEDLTYNQTGIAGIIPNELNGTKTSNGETFDANQMLGTSKTLPLPTIARVTNLDNGKSVTVRVNNRGPFVNSRIMDLSPAAARKIGMNGQAKIQVQVIADQSIAVKNATLGASETTTTTMMPGETVVTTTTTTVSEPAPMPQPTPVAPTGDYSVQIAAFYAQDSADALANRMRPYGDATVVHEGDMYKVRITGLDAAAARRTIDTLRSSEGMAPGLLKNGRWVNPDSI